MRGFPLGARSRAFARPLSPRAGAAPTRLCAFPLDPSQQSGIAQATLSPAGHMTGSSPPSQVSAHPAPVQEQTDPSMHDMVQVWPSGQSTLQTALKSHVRSQGPALEQVVVHVEESVQATLHVSEAPHSMSQMLVPEHVRSHEDAAPQSAAHVADPSQLGSHATSSPHCTSQVDVSSHVGVQLSASAQSTVHDESAPQSGRQGPASQVGSHSSTPPHSQTPSSSTPS